jgi:hypothetical protein
MNYMALNELIILMRMSTARILCLAGVVLFLCSGAYAKDQGDMESDDFFTLDDGRNLSDLGDNRTKELLTCVQGRGKPFGNRQKQRYCALKKSSKPIQWVLKNLETGEIISRSDNAHERFFGASSSKIFVAAAFLDKHNGQFTQPQLRLLTDMIVKSSNSAWLELQRQTGDRGTDNSGREAVEKFTQKMGYTNTRGFQGWMTTKDGRRMHGNELNTMELTDFLYDTYHRKYKGAEILWKIMHATKTGSHKIDKYTPSQIYIGGKTGTYNGPNASPDTVKLDSIRARNHVTILKVKDNYYGLAILTNTGNDEDVAILGGGLIREFLIDDEIMSCDNL